MRNKYLIPVITSVLLFFGAVTNSAADSKGEIGFKVISTKIVMRVEGVNGRAMTWENAKHTKGMIINLQVHVAKDMTLWSPDFNIFYCHKNNKDLEDRGRCRAMTLAVSSPGDDGAWVVGNYVKTHVKAGTRYIKLLFPVENDVQKVSLHYAYPAVKDIPVKRR
jgi:hypothetical protein